MSVGGVGGAGAGVQTSLMHSILKDQAALMSELMESMISVDLQQHFAAEKMELAAGIANAYGGSIDIMA